MKKLIFFLAFVMISVAALNTISCRNNPSNKQPEQVPNVDGNEHFGGPEGSNTGGNSSGHGSAPKCTNALNSKIKTIDMAGGAELRYYYTNFSDCGRIVMHVLQIAGNIDSTQFVFSKKVANTFHNGVLTTVDSLNSDGYFAFRIDKTTRAILSSYNKSSLSQNLSPNGYDMGNFKKYVGGNMVYEKTGIITHYSFLSDYSAYENMQGGSIRNTNWWDTWTQIDSSQSPPRITVTAFTYTYDAFNRVKTVKRNGADFFTNIEYY